MGKRVQKLALKNLASKVLNLGYVGENEHTQIVIDCSEVLWDYEDAVTSVVVQPPRGDMYPVEVTREDDSIIWEIADSDLVYSGTGRVQITFTNDGEVVKSAIGNTKIDPSIMATGTAPTPLENWMERAEETARQMGQDVADATLEDLAETKAECIAEIEQAGADTRATIPADYTQMSDDVTSLKSAFAQLDANVITESAGPAPIVSVTDGADGMPMRKVEVAIEPVQDLHGYDAPWPAGGGVNILPTQDGTWFTSETNNIFLTESGFQLPAGTYNAKMFRNKTSEALAGFYVSTNGGSYERIGSNSSDSEFVRSFTVEASAQIDLKLYCSTAGFDNAGYRVVLSTADITNSAFAPYSNVCPITGWDGVKVMKTGKNLLDKSLGKLYAQFFVIGGNTTEADNTLYLKAGTYTISTSKPVTMYLEDAYQNRFLPPQRNVTSATFTNPKDQYCKFSFTRGSSEQATADTYDYQLELGSTVTAYEPYQGQTYEVTFPADPGTVYGGTLDVVSGKLTIDKALYNMTGRTYTASQTKPGRYYTQYMSSDAFDALNLCSHYPVSANMSTDGACYKSGLQIGFNTAFATLQDWNDYLSSQSSLGAPVTCAVTLRNIVEVTLTAQDIETLLGVNNVWTDAGNTSITYPADTKMYIDRKITEAVANALNA